MATKKKAANGATTAKAPRAKTESKPKVPKPKAPKEDLVVFAFRLTEAERNAIHETAGPARASRFVRQVAAAFAREDDAAFRAILKEAREARG